ncbi:MAG: hypothetical protein KBI12_04740 [Methanothrix sp.]|nr:hypothetical protein [Methanothrix sp.]HQI67477.1 hypothetical protein [Methanothrix sp.]
MHKILIILILILMMCIECYSYDWHLPGGESVSVHGPDSAGSGTGSGQPPVYEYPSSSFSAGNPANYVVPRVKVATPPKTDKDGKLTIIANESGISPMTFAMTSDVNGIGRFSIMNRFDAQGYDNKAYQLLSAKYGSLNQSRDLSYLTTGNSIATDTIEYTLAWIDIKDSMRFFGQSYTDINKFKNKNDFIQDTTRTGAIARTSIYRSQAFSMNNSLFDNYTVYNHTIYKTEGRLVGTSDLHAITDNNEILESYMGNIALNRTILSQLRSNYTAVDSSPLECCSYANSMPT